jgi:hypothetical protein
MGDEAEARRHRASARMQEDPELYPDISALGPEARCNDRVIKTLLEL